MAVSLLPTSVGNERSSGVDRFQGITSRWLPRASTSCAGSSRKVPLHAEARTVLAAWLGDRARLLEELAARGRPAAPAEQAALWLSRRGRRLTTRAIELVVRTLGAEAGLEEELSAHVLRHTCFTNLRRAGVDLVRIAAWPGTPAWTPRGATPCRPRPTGRPRSTASGSRTDNGY